MKKYSGHDVLAQADQVWIKSHFPFFDAIIFFDDKAIVAFYKIGPFSTM